MMQSNVEYTIYNGEKDIEELMELMDASLSEPYSIFTYRWFLQENPELTILARVNGVLVGAVMCRVKERQGREASGNIGMVAVKEQFRKQGIGRELVIRAISMMSAEGIREIFLETEEKNEAALHLYEALGFFRHKYLVRYYSTGENAYRLKLILNVQPHEQ
ncbi:MAG: putative acyl-CoA N-acyltransferase [Streblomastix strix]|uniref:Putative acyl-CoA N-acyltransferase n=1 Tax=Streblomastix strix TaxID=222440 RepID=A0A5J4VVY6_9EUKA|nr:MAG: putative acyl-CoA N-acyltransferase [Streblomastix strix]